MGNHRTFQILLKLKQEYKPDTLFLIETKTDHIFLERVRVGLGFAGKLVVDSIGRSGGLCLFWMESMDIGLISFSNFHIDVQVASVDNSRWRMTGFYGHLETSQRHHAWSLLRRIHAMSDLPWIVIGDFNEILDDSEKIGGLQRPRWQIENFRAALDDCGLQDIGFSGPPFTWCNKRDGDSMIQERLDRCVCNFRWRNLFVGARVCHLEFWRSDHRPILLDFSPNNSLLCQSRKGLRRFHFEECWANKQECDDIVKSVWDKVGSQQTMQGYHPPEHCRTWPPN
jgi:hypothetical protein